MSESESNAERQPKRLGVLAEFAGPDELVEAARQATDAGYRRVEAFSPFPLIGVDDALKARKTVLPWLVLMMGFTGLFGGLTMQCYMNGVEGTWWLSGYQYFISGKPFLSLPAFMPVTFECIILLSAFGAFFGMLGLNQLPKLSNPLFSSARFAAATDDGFFLTVEATDPKYADAETEAFLRSIGATSVEAVEEPVGGHAVPGVIYMIGICAAVIAMLPPLYLWSSATTQSTLPRISFFKDMESQAKFKAQTVSNLFDDGLAMRPPIPGTVARGALREDLRYYEGKNSPDQFVRRNGRLRAQFVAEGDEPETPPEPDWTTEFPESLKLTAELMDRGEERFNIHCAACHGLGGDGDGLVTTRSIELEQGTWVQPTSIHTAAVIEQPVGRIYNTITNGIRKMPAYRELITVEDRWAIVLYIKALQRSRTATAEDLPADKLRELSNVQ